VRSLFAKSEPADANDVLRTLPAGIVFTSSFDTNTVTDIDLIIQAMPRVLRNCRFGYTQRTGALTFDSIAVYSPSERINRRTLGLALKAIGARRLCALKNGVRYTLPGRTPEEAIALVDATVIQYFSQRFSR
jgi:hypothetical protein